jgi:hypothetical protein
MSISSIPFVLFVAVALVLYYLSPYKLENVLLLVASCRFLISWNARFAAVFAFLTVIN